MRYTLTLLHRWAGLFIAGFLFFSGVTGAIISWDHELDEWLNPHLTDARTTGPALDALSLIAAIEARHPHVEVTSVPLNVEPGHAYVFGVEGRVNPETERLHEPGFNEVFVDPASGAENGVREWGAVWPVTTENFVSFLYVLHYSLHLPEFAGIDLWGLWLLGGVALIWTIDCFIGFYLTLPSRRRKRDEPTAVEDKLAEDAPQSGAIAAKTWWQRWQPAWRVRWRGGSYKLNFDVHRAFGLWTWLLLFIVAFTAFSLNLYREVFFPAMSLVSDVTPGPFDVRTPADHNEPITPAITFAQAIERADDEAERRGWSSPPGDVYYSREYGIYGVAYYLPEEGHGVGGAGHKTLYVDGVDGALLGDYLPWTGTAADLFVQAQFPLHSGRILGLPGRILISLMGLVVAALSVTGVIVWWRKRAARQRTAGRTAARGTPKGAANGLAATPSAALPRARRSSAAQSVRD